MAGGLSVFGQHSSFLSALDKHISRACSALSIIESRVTLNLNNCKFFGVKLVAWEPHTPNQGFNHLTRDICTKWVTATVE